jgi:hypothetical protein
MSRYPSLFASKNTMVPPPGLVPKLAVEVILVNVGNVDTSDVTFVAAELRTSTLPPEVICFAVM